MNLTSMLVLTTIFIDVSNNLPKTSYMKMIDVWLLFTLLQPFLTVLTHTYMDTLTADDDDEKALGNTKEENSKKLSSIRRFVLLYNPILVTIFVAFYWIVGLNHAGII